MTPREKLHAAATAVRDLGLTGRWRWAGNIGRGQAPVLCTERGGQRYVMTFTRRGMSCGQPQFPVQPAGQRWVGMERACDMPIYEVCPEAVDPHDPRVYREDVIGFRSPVADYLAAADADTILTLLDENQQMRDLLAEVAARVVVCSDTCDCDVRRARRLIGAAA